MTGRRTDAVVIAIIKYGLVFWGLCVVAGAATAVGLANAGMGPQDAFNSGAVIAFLPAIVVAVGAVLFFFFG